MYNYFSTPLIESAGVFFFPGTIKPSQKKKHGVHREKKKHLRYQQNNNKKTKKVVSRCPRSRYSEHFIDVEEMRKSQASRSCGFQNGLLLCELDLLGGRAVARCEVLVGSLYMLYVDGNMQCSYM